MDIHFDYSGRTVLVTGGTRGIGRSMVEAYLAAGATVHATGTSADVVEGLNADAPERLTYHATDFLQADSLARLVDWIGTAGPVDVLVNNAGINRVEAAVDVPKKDLREILEVNLVAPYRIAQAVAPSMVEAGYGRMLNVASIWSVITKPGRSAYTSSKSGLAGLTRTLAAELAPHGVLVNTLSPGFTRTELTESTMSDSDLQAVEAQIPLGRLATTDEMTRVALFLTSSTNSYLTGQNIVVDGGFTIV